MKYRFSRTGYKLIAFLLAVLALMAAAAGGMLAIWSAENANVLSEDAYQTTWICRQSVNHWGQRIVDELYYNPEYANWESLPEETDLRFIALDESDGTILDYHTDGMDIDFQKLLSGLPDSAPYAMYLGKPGTALEGIYVLEKHYIVGQDYYYDESFGISQELAEEDTRWRILLLLPQNLSFRAGDPIWENFRVWDFGNRYFEPALILAAGAVLILLGCLVYLCCQAGRRPGQDEIVLIWYDRIPLDLLLGLTAIAAVGFAAMFAVAGHIGYIADLGKMQVLLVLAAVVTALLGLVNLATLVSLTARLKQGKWWRSMLLWRIAAWLCRLLSRLFRKLTELFRAVALVPKGFAVIAAVTAVQMLLLAACVSYWDIEFYIFLFFLLELLLAAAAVFGLAQMRRLQQAAGKLAEGELNAQLDTRGMFWEFRRHGDHLNSIAQGMNLALEQRMKSERLKTELITNVSHDIKTPLTSIVNYVDLLQKPHSEQEQAEYLQVLARQSKKLKHLTEDLVEASKAATGNIPVESEPVRAAELLHQAVEEYRERLQSSILEPILQVDANLSVLADGKLLWRVLDNLLNNVVKYAMPGTRVYITAHRTGSRAILSVKNVSKDELNISADELMERFTRGDSSRHTEGSGLGLNIARSLTQLMKGDFRLTVDGDLFKAEILLPLQETQ